MDMAKKKSHDGNLRIPELWGSFLSTDNSSYLPVQHPPRDNQSLGFEVVGTACCHHHPCVLAVPFSGFSWNFIFRIFLPSFLLNPQ